MKNPNFLGWLVVIIFISPFFYFRNNGHINDESVKPKVHNKENVIAYDWEHDRNITQSMADTMVFTGGHWYGKSNLPKTKPAIANSEKELKWIKPAGKEYRFNNRKEDYLHWKAIQEYESQHECLTEDDIHQIIITEYER